MKKTVVFRLLLALLLVGLLAWRLFFVCGARITGTTMGTTYSIIISDCIPRTRLRAVREAVEKRLREVNREMSDWIPESEISRFNASRSTNDFPVSPSFARVVAEALAVSRATGGAFDPTLGPLLDLWGFGSGGAERRVPSEDDIRAALRLTGPEKIHVDPARSLLRKDLPGLRLDLGGIAKGYGVDAVGEVLDRFGCRNWMVEIGGEIALRGKNPDRKPWCIAVQYPSSNPAEIGRPAGLLHLTRGAVATSGNYRNFVERDGRLYAHILDPRTGRAVLSPGAGVTVVADTCAEADALATAIFVMGPDEGIAWVEAHPGIEALFLVHEKGGAISEKISSGFRKRTGYSRVR